MFITLCEYIMADIIYTLCGGTYINITNKCPCRCTFCIRSQGNAVGDAENLWFYGNEPSLDDIKKAVDDYGFEKVDAVCFCGYGEPTERLDVLIATANYLRTINPSIKIRVNTNGLSDLINGRSTAKEIGEAFDIVSVSLNDPDSDSYDAVTRNIFPKKAFPSLLEFTKECAKYCPEVHMSVVDVIGEENIEKSRKLAESLGAKFICRSFDEGR